MDPFHDKTAIVTGGASGIGRALCEEMGRRGASVLVADLNGEGARRVASTITANGGTAIAARLDVSESADVYGLIDNTVSEHGRLDYMFNNAGIGMGGEVRDMTPVHWRRIVDVNLWGVIYGTTGAYEVMVKQGFGHIVNVASLAGLNPIPTAAAYGATKHAVVGLSTSLRAEAIDHGVKVSVVCPGFVQTGIYDSGIILQANREQALSKIPFKMMEATRAAHLILRGVLRNKPIIVFPNHARILWWLYRLQPALLAPFSRKVVRDFRSVRIES